MTIKKRTFGLRARLILLVLLSGLPALAAILWSGIDSMHQARDAARTQALRFALQTADAQRMLVDLTRARLQALAASPLLDPDEPANCNAFLKEQLAGNPSFGNIGFIRPDGMVACSAVPLQAPLDVSDRGYFQDALKTKGYVLSDYLVGRVTHNPSVILAHAVTTAAGYLRGVVYLQLPLTWLQRLLDSSGLPAGSSICVVTHSGHILAHYPEDDAAARWQTVWPQLLQTVRHSNYEGTADLFNPLGVRKLYGFAPLQGVSQPGAVFVTVGIPAQLAYAAARQALLHNLLILAATMILMVLLAAWAGHAFVLRQISALWRATRALATGSLGARVDVVNGPAELSDLALGFNDMAASIERHHRELASTNRNLHAQIEERRRAETALRESESRYRIVVGSLREVIFQTDPQGRWAFLNAAWQEITGFTVADSLGRRLLDFVHVEDKDVLDGRLQALLRQEVAECRFEARLIGGDGQARWVEGNIRVLLDMKGDMEGAVEGASGTLIDITERKLARQLLEDSSRRLDLAMAAGKLGAWEWNMETGAVWNSAANLRMLNGVDDCDEVVRLEDFLSRVHPDDRMAVGRSLARDPDSTGMRQIEYRVVWPNGETRHLVARGTALTDANGRMTRMIGVTLDVTEQKEQEQRLAWLAQYDGLTGLPNRNLFRDRLGQAMARAVRHQQQVALLFFDLDKFKEVNDQLGHHAGDRVLVEAAERIRGCLRDSDTLARLSGDEFTAVLEDVQGVEQAPAVVDAILHAFKAPFVQEGMEFFLTVSIGLAFYPEHDHTIDGLLKKADLAMYQAKMEGRNNYQVFSRQIERQAEEHLHLKNQLRHALERGQLLLHYQPQVCLRSGRISGIESLLRWRHPDFGDVPPARFIPIAEETGLIGAIGRWVLETACQQAADWQRAGLPEVRVSVNLSPRQLRQAGLVDEIGAALDASGLEARRLELEITEGLVVDNIERGRDVLARLRDMGVRVALDDFGTGYSSLSYLKDLPLDALKMDGSFSRHLSSPQDTVIARGIIAMAHSLGLQVVAEGVETAEQMAMLADNGCDHIQGYLFSRPVPAEAMAALLGQERLLDLSATGRPAPASEQA